MTEARHPNGLDALRAFAALSVLGLHLIYVPDWTGFPSTGPLAWFRVGFLGVDIFFVLSGYVIGLSAIRLFPLHGPPRSADFVKRRFARIVPLYWIVSLLFLFAVDSSALTGDNAILQILSHLFFFHNLMPSTAGAINGVTWTLATEMQLYLITALFIRTLVNTRPLVIASVMILLAWGWRASTFVLRFANHPLAHFTHIGQLKCLGSSTHTVWELRSLFIA